MKYIKTFNEASGVSLTAYDEANRIYLGILKFFEDGKQLNKGANDEITITILNSMFIIKFKNVLDVSTRSVKFRNATVSSIRLPTTKNKTKEVYPENLICITYIIGYNNTYLNILEDIKISKNDIISILAHEIKHVEDVNTAQTFEQFLNDRIFTNLIQLPQIDRYDTLYNFIYCCYMVSFFEKSVFNTEFYTILKSNNINKNEFKYKMSEYDRIGLIKKFKSYSYSDLINDFKKEGLDVYEITRLYQDIIVPMYIQCANQCITEYNDDQKVLNDYIRKIQSITYETYFKNQMKYLNIQCTKMFRKASKIYQML